MSASRHEAFAADLPAGRGLLVSLSKITNHDLLSDEVYNTWYNEVHLQDVLATGTVERAYRFKNANPDADRPYLAVYVCPDLSAVTGEKLKTVPFTSDLLPAGRTIHELASFDTRFYTLVQEYEKSKQDQYGLFQTLLLAGMTPTEGTDADLDAWYREEHLDQMSLESGFRRAMRYDLIQQVKSEDHSESMDDATKYLALYEFDESNKLGANVEALDPMTNWTKRILQSTKKVEAFIYHQIKALP